MQAMAEMSSTVGYIWSLLARCNHDGSLLQV
jgi:hypothetical protein